MEKMQQPSSNHNSKQSTPKQSHGLSSAHHRGVVEGISICLILAFSAANWYFYMTANGRVQHECSIDFLLALSTELMRARAYKVVAVVRDTNEEEQIERLRFLIHELRRLTRHHHLFPSEAIKARFFALLGLDSSLQLERACVQLLLKAEFRNIAQYVRKTETRKSYLDGSRGWENFLLNGAPGFPRKFAQKIPKSAIQVLPGAGMRIIGELQREENDIVRFVNEVRLPYVSFASYSANADQRSQKYQWRLCRRKRPSWSILWVYALLDMSLILIFSG